MISLSQYPKKISEFSARKWYIRGFQMLLLAGFLTSLISIIVFRWVNPGITMLMLNKHYKALMDGKNAKIQKEWVSIDRISPNMVLAAVSAEDNRFTAHWGFDIESIQNAMKSNKKGRRLKGASTISQQTAKNIFLWPKRSWVRKGFEAYFTLCMETLWSKKRIMEVYLNIAEFGQGVYGVESACQKYFKKSSADINKPQAAMLTTLLPNPTKRNPNKPSAYMVRYQQRVLWNMNNIVSVDFSGNSLEKKSTTKKSKPKK